MPQSGAHDSITIPSVLISHEMDSTFETILQGDWLLGNIVLRKATPDCMSDDELTELRPTIKRKRYVGFGPEQKNSST